MPAKVLRYAQTTANETKDKFLLCLQAMKSIRSFDTQMWNRRVEYNNRQYLNITLPHILPLHRSAIDVTGRTAEPVGKALEEKPASKP